jgi:hypothetical protein
MAKVTVRGELPPDDPLYRVGLKVVSLIGPHGGMADATDSKSVTERCEGSTPFAGTMVSHPVHDGSVGINKSATEGLFLLQVTDDSDQARAVLTKEEFEKLIERMKKMLEG